MTCIARVGHGCGSAAAVAVRRPTPAMALHKARCTVICTSLDLPKHTAATRSSERTSLALRPLQHRVEELEPLLLQIAQHVFGDGWKGLPDQDVESERRRDPLTSALLRAICCSKASAVVSCHAMTRKPIRSSAARVACGVDRKLMLLSLAQGAG